jgi:hypothetical protein
VSSTTHGLEQIAAHVDGGQFDDLFIGELGWDNPPDPRPVRFADPSSGTTLIATPVAAKRGVVVYHCNTIPSRDDIESLDRQVSRRSTERLLIFTSGSEQQWRWPEPRRSGGTRYATHAHIAGAANPALFQRLNAVRFTMTEEDSLTVLAVRERVRASFNADEVTSRFYKEFRETQQDLMSDIVGIPGSEDRTWYSSLLLNRLMFIYFMQRKGFLNNDPHYLRNSLKGVQALKGKNSFFEYYRDFLIPLFHEGLGSEERKYADPDIASLIGDVPYINGGIFALHELEASYSISVPDETFEKVFDFFDRYRWHLDERPTGNPEEINPEILGHIFEKYVNQKAQGAYYTHDDVTGYMTAMVIAPRFLDRLGESVSVSFDALLAENPSRYVPEGLRYGAELELPDEVVCADVASTGILDEMANADVGIPGERWRETLDRRKHYTDLVGRLGSGEAPDVNEMVTLNLEVLTLATDYVNDLVEPFEVAAAYDVLNSLRVVDPTCGSGAFLFSALDVLEELYGAVLARAEKLVEKGVDTPDRDLSAICNEVASHFSRDYFVLKTIVLANLYGVDLMPEATEIARLRLFLALVARLHKRSQVEPLPDLDMNIRAGNLLVGCITPEDASVRFSSDLLVVQDLEGISSQAKDIAAIYRDFVKAQRAGEHAAVIDDLKANLQENSDALRDRLDLLYSPENTVGPKFDQWRATHHPFHWFIEFPDVIYEGGFDAVIGNPPYVPKKDIPYRYSGFTTDYAKDIFAPCMERAATLVKPSGRYTMIVPIAFQFSKDYNSARAALSKLLPVRWVSTYSRNPSALFDAGLGVRSTIVIGASEGESLLTTTDLRRWYDKARPYLFSTNRYVKTVVPGRDPWPRTGHPGTAELYEALTSSHRVLGEAVTTGQYSLGYKKTALYYLSAFVDDPPAWTVDGKRSEQTQIGKIRFATEANRDIAFLLLAGRLGVWWWATIGDDFHVTSAMLTTFPVAPSQLTGVSAKLTAKAKALRAEQPKHPVVTKYAGREMGNYDMLRCRHITDDADQLVLNALGLGHLWPALLLADARFAKATGERSGTEREWPFPFEPQS